MSRVEFQLGQFVLSYDPKSPHCGWNCECCEYDDGTAPADHERYCGLITSRDGDCTCVGADERAKDRKKVHLRVGSQGDCPHGRWR